MPRIEIAGRSVRLADACIIGRDRTCHLAVNHPSISGEHARIFSQDGGWFVEDLLSATGTAVNGKPVLAGAQPLADGDTIAVGEVAVRFFLAAAPAAAASPAPDAPDPRSLLGREVSGFAVTAFAREETAGPAFQARHARTGREVLLRVFDPEVVAGEGAGFVDRFRDLVAVLAANRHPDLPRVFQVGCEGPFVWYATDIPAGSSLVQGGLVPLQAVEAVLGIARLLAALHDAALVHGDLRPALIHRDEAGRVRLGSLGLAGLNAANRRRLQAAGAARQAAYLDPVQARSGDCNVKSDIYSAGCILVELLTGRPPFAGASPAAVAAAHAEEPIPQLAARLRLPAALDGILGGMLAKEHLDRYNDFAALIPDLEGLRDAIVAKAQGGLAGAMRRLIGR